MIFFTQERLYVTLTFIIPCTNRLLLSGYAISMYLYSHSRPPKAGRSADETAQKYETATGAKPCSRHF